MNIISRQATCALLDAIEAGMFDKDMLLQTILSNFMSESDVQELIELNDWIVPGYTEEDEEPAEDDAPWEEGPQEDIVFHVDRDNPKMEETFENLMRFIGCYGEFQGIVYEVVTPDGFLIYDNSINTIYQLDDDRFEKWSVQRTEKNFVLINIMETEFYQY
jgi:hypothetical protein